MYTSIFVIKIMFKIIFCKKLEVKLKNKNNKKNINNSKSTKYKIIILNLEFIQMDYRDTKLVYLNVCELLYQHIEMVKV